MTNASLLAAFKLADNKFGGCCRIQLIFMDSVESTKVFPNSLIFTSTIQTGSDYFAAMLSHDTKEKQTGIAVIKEAEPSCVKKCIEFIYTGISPELEDDIEPLMHVASLMQLSTLCDGIVELLDENLDLESFFVTWRVANLYDRKQLMEKCDRLALDNIKEIAKLDGFVQFDKSYIKKLLSTTFDGIQEKNKLHALLCWARFDSQTRNKVMDELLKFIKLSKISASCLRHVVENETLINDNNQRLKLFYQATADNMALKSRSFSDDSNMTDIAIFDQTSGYLQKFNPIDNSWMQMQKMNVMMKSNFSAVCVGNYIYVLMRNKSVFRLYYLDESAAWERKGDMLYDHGLNPPAVVMQNCIYVIGGHDLHSTKSVEKYDTSSGIWTKLADKLKASRFSTTLALNDQIYCCGGLLDTGYTNAVERFNPDSSVWNSVAPMNEAKGYTAVVTFDGKLYVLGGCKPDPLATVECYDPNHDRWTLLKPMNTARGWFQSFEITGEIYAVGGYFGISPNSIEKYNPEKNVWVDVKMPGNMKIVESVKIKVKC